ncbi:MAG: glucosaminidase domain-containing protein, partial [Eubacteriaceae bacterium]
DSNGIVQWYEGQKNANGDYEAKIDPKRHNGAYGSYSFVSYGKDGNYSPTVLGNAWTNLENPEETIMGISKFSERQLIAFFNDSGKRFPDYYVVRGVNLEKFVRIYMEEAEKEEVRAEVAFAQAMLETGFLQFGGDVNITQFNFAGLGATGNGVPGFNFGARYGDNEFGIRMGIRGHIQHLRCYGSNLPTVQENVDPRWFDYSRPRAITVEGLSGTWAADLSYANKLLNMLNKIKML